MPSSRTPLLCGIALALCASLPASSAEDERRGIDEIIVFARERTLIGEAGSSSEGVIGYGDFSTRPLLRAGELVEVIPGMVATQHSGTGKANQYFLRGFNLDHGTDFAAHVDGVPINMRSHGHGQGYLDLNFLIPEIVETVTYFKGPYHAEIGDFASAGAAYFKTYDRLNEGFAEAGVGEDGFHRLVIADSAALGGGDLLAAAETQTYDGPWDRPEGLERFNGLAKFTREGGGIRVEASLSGYKAQWDSTDQIPLRALESGLISRLGTIDDDVGGKTARVGLKLAGSLGALDVLAYATYYEINLFSDFTYVLADPVNGDEFEQQDRRWIYGGALRHAQDIRLLGQPATLRSGIELRYDDIGAVGLYQTAGRKRLATVRRDAVEQGSAGLFGEFETALSDRLRLTLGLRGDFYAMEVESDNPANSGDENAAALSPKAALAFAVSEALELYANYGQGFHSNDARGTTISVDPVTLAPADPVDPLVKSEGAELGFRTEPLEGLTLALAGFWLDLDSELVYVGDAGVTEPSGASRRYGLELSAFYRPLPFLVFDLSAAATRARFSDAPAGEDRIPGAVEDVVGAGVTLVLEEGLTASLRLRHFSEAPLIEDNSVRSKPTTLVNLGASYAIGRVNIGLEVLNLFDSDDNDITYFYESQLPGEGAAVEDIHFHPVEPRTLRARVRLRF